jgi:hypothetical protein
MDYTYPGVAHQVVVFERAVEQSVEDHVPGQGKCRDCHGHDAHVEQRFVHDPRQQRGADQDGQQFETNGLEKYVQ